MRNEKEIHEIDFGNNASVNNIGQLDVLLSEVHARLRDIGGSLNALFVGKKKTAQTDEIASRMNMLLEYIRGYKGGNRFGKDNPFKELLKNSDNKEQP